MRTVNFACGRGDRFRQLDAAFPDLFNRIGAPVSRLRERRCEALAWPWAQSCQPSTSRAQTNREHWWSEPSRPLRRRRSAKSHPRSSRLGTRGGGLLPQKEKEAERETGSATKYSPTRKCPGENAPTSSQKAEAFRSCADSLPSVSSDPQGHHPARRAHVHAASLHRGNR